MELEKKEKRTKYFIEMKTETNSSVEIQRMK